MLRNPELRNKPLGIQQKYIIVTCNYVARERGLTKLMTIKDAREKCPDLVLVSGEDLTNYRHMSYKISNYLQKYCPLVERLGFDENFLDITELVNDRINYQSVRCPTDMKGHVYMSDSHAKGTCTCGCRERLAVGSHIAEEIRAGLLKELGITCCGGIAHNKLLSKLVAGTYKPNQQTTLFPDKVNILMSSLNSVRSIQGIGHTTARRLKELGVVTVTDLQNAETSVLDEEFGHTSVETMKKLCIGVDDSPVIAFGLPQTLSDEDSFKKCSDSEDAKARMRPLINSLLQRLLEDGRRPQTLRLSVRKMLETNRYSNRESRQCNIPPSLFNKFSADNMAHTSIQLEALAYSLFTKMVDIKSPFHLTLINVAFAKLEQKSSNDISNFFSPKKSPNSRSTAQCSSRKEDCDPSIKVQSTPFELKTKSSKSEPENNSSPHRSASTKSVSGIQKWLVKQPAGNESNYKDLFDLATNSANTEDCRKDADTLDVYESIHRNRALKRQSVDNSCDATEENFTKRKRLSVSDGSGNPDLPSNFTELLPPDLDRSVFLELPHHIQKDILANAATYHDSNKLKPGTPAQATNLNKGIPKTSVVMPSACSPTLDNEEIGKTRNVHSETKVITNNVKIINHTSSSETEVEHVAEDERSKTCRLFKKSSVNRKDVVQDQQSLRYLGKNYVKAQQQDGCTSGRQSEGHLENNPEEVSVPDGIDHAVFASLPPEIKEELIRQWKIEKPRKGVNSGKSKSPDKHYFKSPKPSASNSITDYFSKRT
ncbi:DNA polymerase iota-like isoform X2 [Mercenaria mercenaria]|nr:DNA polymerase iota-like isoform X2 [Mercenaria mercenaria]